MAKMFLLLLLLAALQAQNPDNQELESAPASDFLNFTGRHQQVDSRNDIYNIGLFLSEKLDQQRSNYFNKYTLIRVIAPGDEGLFDADILVLEARAGVDHIRNLRLIISAYLSAQYGFDLERASTLATFISYYNVYYRGNITYFKGKYKPQVLALLEADKVGLANDYRQWAGQTQIVIPLSSDRLLEIPPQPSLAEAGQPAVSEKIMAEEDEEIALQLRDNMVGQRREDLSDKQQKLDQLKEEQQVEQQQLNFDKEKLNGIIQQSNSAKERKNAENTLAQTQQKSEQNQQLKDRIERKQQQLAQQKEILNQEENQLQSAYQASRLDNSALYFSLLTKDDQQQLVRISLASLRINAKVEIDDIRSSSLWISGDYLYLVSGQPAYLTRIKAGDLKVDTQSKEQVFAAAPLWHFDDLPGLLTVVAGNEDGQWFLGHYDEQLELLAKSEIEILSYTSLQYRKNKLFLQDRSGQIVVLNSDTLVKEKDIGGAG